jgi:hypothetical protein
MDKGSVPGINVAHRVGRGAKHATTPSTTTVTNSTSTAGINHDL